MRIPGHAPDKITTLLVYLRFTASSPIQGGLPPSTPPPSKQAYSTEYLLYLLQDKDNVKCVRIYRGVAYTNIIRKLSNVMQEMKIESSQSTDVLLFKRFFDNYTQFTTDMNNMHFSINSPHCPIPDHKKENVIFFLKSISKLNNKYEGRFQGINRFIYILFGRKA